jgi:hypothetical protein
MPVWYMLVYTSTSQYENTRTGIYRYIPQCMKSSSLVQVVEIPDDGVPVPTRSLDPSPSPKNSTKFKLQHQPELEMCLKIQCTNLNHDVVMVVPLAILTS